MTRAIPVLNQFGWKTLNESRETDRGMIDNDFAKYQLQEISGIFQPLVCAIHISYEMATD